MRGAMLVAWLCLCGAAASAAETSNALPAGLATIWRVDGRKLDARASAWSVAAFSTDGSIVGISDDAGTRLYRASDGALVRVLPPPFAVGQYAFALAVSSGRWLAFQAAHGTQEIAPGLVTVVGPAEPHSLEASAKRTRVQFAQDGSSLLAANVLRVDDAGSVGTRTWSAASWRRVRDVPGALMPRGAVGPFALNDRVAAYQRDGRMELRDLASGALVWAVPLVAAVESSSSAMTLELVAFAANGEWLLAFESPVRGAGPGAAAVTYDLGGHAYRSGGALDCVSRARRRTHGPRTWQSPRGRSGASTSSAKRWADGFPILDGSRRAGDGYYECVVLDPDGKRMEITVGESSR